MGREIGREGIETIKVSGDTAEQLASKLIQEAGDISNEISSIELVDEDDQAIIDSMPEQYQTAFDGEFQNEVDPIGQDIESESDQVVGEMTDEVGKVEEGISSLETAASISDVGSDIASSGQEALENSRNEYEVIISEAERVAEDAMKMIEEYKNELGDAF